MMRSVSPLRVARCALRVARCVSADGTVSGKVVMRVAQAARRTPQRETRNARRGTLRKAAEPSDPPAELREGLEQLLAPEVGPAYRCRIVLGIRRLPQEKVAEAHLATRADHQVELGQTRGVQVLVDQLLGNVFGSNAAGHRPLHRSHDLLATAI